MSACSLAQDKNVLTDQFNLQSSTIMLEHNKLNLLSLMHSTCTLQAVGFSYAEWERNRFLSRLPQDKPTDCKIDCFCLLSAASKPLTFQWTYCMGTCFNSCQFRKGNKSICGKLITNFPLTDHEGHTAEYWPQGHACMDISVCTRMTAGQNGPVWLEQKPNRTCRKMSAGELPVYNYLQAISAMCTPTLMLHRNEIECTK